MKRAFLGSVTVDESQLPSIRREAAEKLETFEADYAELKEELQRPRRPKARKVSS